MRSAHSQLDFQSPPCSLTPGHRVSVAEDQPLISGVCRKLGLMGGPGSQDGVGRLDQQLPGQSQRPGPSEVTYLGRTYWGVLQGGILGVTPGIGCLGRAQRSPPAFCHHRSRDGNTEQGSGENTSLWSSSSSGCYDGTQKGRCL